MSDKTYFIKQETHYSYEDEREEDQFIVIEAERLGQFYRKDEQGYEWPGYCWTLREMTRKKSYEAAEAYVDGLKHKWYNEEEADIRDPFSSGIVSLGLPGKLPLDEDGGPLLFTIVSGAVK